MMSKFSTVYREILAADEQFLLGALSCVILKISPKLNNYP